MKNGELRTDDGERGPASNSKRQVKPEHGADSQLYKYNVMLSRLADLFEEDGDPEPPKPGRVDME